MDVYSKARDFGIELEFQDGQGRRHAISSERLRSILGELPPRAQHSFLKQPVVLAQDTDPRRVEMASDANGLGWRLVAGNDELARGGVTGATIELPSAHRRRRAA